MLTLEDCIEMCGLTHEEIRYLVNHEHISELRAAELGERYVLVDDAGTPHLRRAIVTDIEQLKQQHKQREAKELEHFIRDFVISHPHMNTVRPMDS